MPDLLAGIGSTFAQTAFDGPLIAAIAVAALAGAVSFASPCVLPLVPGYVGYVTGLSGDALRDRRTGRVVLGISLFVLGFAVVFVALGTLFSGLGMVLAPWIDLVTRIMGVVVILAGIVFLGGFRFFQREARILARPRAGLWGARPSSARPSRSAGRRASAPRSPRCSPCQPASAPTEACGAGRC